MSRHIAAATVVPALSAATLNGVGFVNMYGALEASSLGETGAHWILAGALELGIIGTAIQAYVLHIHDRNATAPQVLTWVLSLVSAAIGYTHALDVGDEPAVRWLIVTAAPLSALLWHFTLTAVEALRNGVSRTKAREVAAMGRAIVSALDLNYVTSKTTEKSPRVVQLVHELRVRVATHRAYRARRHAAVNVSPTRQAEVSADYLAGVSATRVALDELAGVDTLPDTGVGTDILAVSAPVSTDTDTDTTTDTTHQADTGTPRNTDTDTPTQKTVSAPKAVAAATQPERITAPVARRDESNVYSITTLSNLSMEEKIEIVSKIDLEKFSYLEVGEMICPEDMSDSAKKSQARRVIEALKKRTA